jgi:hypothetical protein
MDAERHADAVALLSEQPDDASPVDWAWMLTQRGRARAEIGNVAPARQDAAAALRAVVGDQNDVTASAIGAAAAELLFQTAPWGQASLDELITANDTAVSWWRTQTLSTALRAAADRTFRQWADEQATRIDFEDTVNDRLFAALVSADLTAEQGTWRATGSLLARNTLIVQHARGDTSRLTDALDELRRSGDDKSLALAASRLWAIGPLGPLADAAGRIQPGSWTHTTARANLALWQHAGDVLDEATASDTARYCLNILTDSSAFVSRTTPSFLVVPYTLDALSGLLGAADDALHRDLARFIVALPPVTDQLEARGWARVATGLRATVFATSEDRATWRQAAASQPDRRLAAAILGLLTDYDEEARELLSARIVDGDNAALGHVRQLNTEVAEQLMAQDAELLDATIAQAQQGVHPIWTRDPAARLAILGVHFPDVAPWEVLLRYLGHAHVPSERKLPGARSACRPAPRTGSVCPPRSHPPAQGDHPGRQPARLTLRRCCHDPRRRRRSPRRPDPDQRPHSAAHRLPAGAPRRRCADRPPRTARVHRRARSPPQRPSPGGSRRSRLRARHARGKRRDRYRPAGYHRPATSARRPGSPDPPRDRRRPSRSRNAKRPSPRTHHAAARPPLGACRRTTAHVVHD